MSSYVRIKKGNSFVKITKTQLRQLMKFHEMSRSLVMRKLSEGWVCIRSVETGQWYLA